MHLRETIRNASEEKLDLKAYEADMRYLIDKYIEADEPRKISPFDSLSLLELIVKLGIEKAVETMPEGIRDNQAAVAEIIENNIRSKIIREHLNDPAFYEQMSAVLAEIIADRKAKAITYEAYLKRAAEAAKRVEMGTGDDTPPQLDTPGKRALYNHLMQQVRPQPSAPSADRVAEAPVPYGEAAQNAALERAIQIDALVKQVRPDDWRGIDSRENVIKRALYDALQDKDMVERVFPILVQQREY